MKRRAFTVLELLTVIGIIAVLIGLLLPAAEHVRHQAYIDKCASNLRQIGLALTMYENENHGQFPRTRSDDSGASMLVSGTGANAPDPFIPGGVSFNDLTAGPFLLMNDEHLGPAVMICPYDDDTDFTPDPVPTVNRSNFTDQKVNLGYSFANPYPSLASEHAGYVLNNHMPADFALAADRNPGMTDPGDNIYSATPTSPPSVMRAANSLNHERDGQNVLYGDGHVAWFTNPFAGVNNDNIFTAQGAVPPLVNASPATPTDSVLLPSDD